jgi:hypothetical protein
MAMTRIKQIQRAVNIGCVIQLGIRDRWSDPGAGGQVDHLIEFAFLDGLIHKTLISDIANDQTNLIPDPRDVLMFDLRMVVVIELVQNRHLVAFIQNPFREV